MYALDIASRCAGTVFLYHVYDRVESPFIETIEVRKEYNLENERELMGRLHALRRKWQHQHTGVHVLAVLGRSPLVGSIVKFIRDEQVNLVVMGTQGASGLKKAIVGTIAARIIEKSTVPVLLVPEQFEWRPPKKIVLVTNYHHDDLTAMATSGELAGLYNALVEIVHFADVLADKEQGVAAFDEYIAGLRMKFPDIEPAASILSVYSVTDALETLHERVPYDILVMVRHKQKFLERFFAESCTRHMAYLTRKPLLVVPGAE